MAAKISGQLRKVAEEVNQGGKQSESVRVFVHERRTDGGLLRLANAAPWHLQCFSEWSLATASEAVRQPRHFSNFSWHNCPTHSILRSQNWQLTIEFVFSRRISIGEFESWRVGVRLLTNICFRATRTLVR